MEETGVSGENDWSATSHREILSRNVASSTTPEQWAGFELTTLGVIGTDCIGSCKSNYHKITTTTVPKLGNEVKNICN